MTPYILQEKSTNCLGVVCCAKVTVNMERGGGIAYLNKNRDEYVMYSCSSTVVARGGGIVAGLRVSRLGRGAGGVGHRVYFRSRV